MVTLVSAGGRREIDCWPLERDHMRRHAIAQRDQAAVEHVELAH